VAARESWRRENEKSLYGGASAVGRRILTDAQIKSGLQPCGQPMAGGCCQPTAAANTPKGCIAAVRTTHS